MSDVVGRAELEVEAVLAPGAAQSLQSNFQRISQAVERSVNPARQATDNLNRSVGALGRTTTQTRQQFTQFGGSLNQMEKGLITVAIAATQVGATLSRMITRPILDAFKEGISSASSLTETINLTGIVFGEATDEVVEWAETLDRSFGLTQEEALKARSNFARLFQELGLGLDEMSELSQTLVERIGDIASALETPVPEVIQRIQSGLVGETEAVRRLGIVLDEEVIKREALRQGIIKQGEALTSEQKIALRGQQIIEQTNELIGDAANTANTFAGVQRQLRVVQNDLNRSLGEIFLPILTRLGSVLIGVLEAFSNLPAPIRALAVAFGLLLAIVGPLLIIFGQLASATLALRGAASILTPLLARMGVAAGISAGGLSGLAISIGAVVAPLLPFIAIGAAVAFVLVRMFQRSEEFRTAVNDLFASISSLVSVFTDLASNVLPPLLSAFTELVDQIADLATPFVVATIEDLADAFDTVARVVNIVSVGIQELVGFLDDAQVAADQLRGTFLQFPGSGILGDIFSFLGQQIDETSRLGKAGLDVLEEALGITADRGIELGNDFIAVAKSAGTMAVSFEDLNKGLKDVIKDQEKLISLQEKVVKAQESVTRALEGVTTAQDRVATAIEKVADAHNSLRDAQERLAESTQTLVDLENERLLLINDTERDVSELADAEDSLLRVRFRLLDLDREELELLEQIAELNLPASAQEIAQADRDIERAKIALNRAIRAEEALLNRLNEEQKETVDLTGLSLDQIRTRLAGIRAQTAAQRRAQQVSKTEENIEEKQLEARLNVGDAQQRLNDLLEDRTELENRVINNAGKIVELEQRLERLTIDRRDATRRLGDAQDRLNRLRAGETSRAEDIERIDKRIVSAKKDQETAAKGVVTATNNIKTAVDAVAVAERAVLTAIRDVRSAEADVLQAKRDQRFETVLLQGSEQEINRILRERLGLNAQLTGQQEEAARAVLRALLPALTDPTQRAHVAFRANFGSPEFLRALGLALINDPSSPLQDILRRLGVAGFAEGGLITRPITARMGENFRPEMVLPLTKPDRVWDLLSRTLPRYPGALAAAQSAIGAGPGSSDALAKVVGSSGKKTIGRADGPMTYGQAQEIIRLLVENGKSEIHVEAPIQVSTPVEDPEHLARRVSQRVERSILEKLRR